MYSTGGDLDAVADIIDMHYSTVFRVDEKHWQV